jgi:hypothetical protein
MSEINDHISVTVYALSEYQCSEFIELLGTWNDPQPPQHPQAQTCWGSTHDNRVDL